MLGLYWGNIGKMGKENGNYYIIGIVLPIGGCAGYPKP